MVFKHLDLHETDPSAPYKFDKMIAFHEMQTKYQLSIVIRNVKQPESNMNFETDCLQHSGRHISISRFVFIDI
jgi:hypothetical protein